VAEPSDPAQDRLVKLLCSVIDIKLNAYIFIFSSILGFFSGISFIADLFCQFRVQLAAGLVVITALLAFVYRRTRGTESRPVALKVVILSALALILNLVSIGFTTLAIPGVNQSSNEIVSTFNKVSPVPSFQFSQAGKNLTLVQFNLRNRNHEFGKFKDYVRKLQPDVLCLEEYTGSWELNLAELKKDYPYVISRTRRDPFGIAIFSKYPMRTSSIISFVAPELPSAYCQIEVQGRTIGVLATHPMPPLNGEFYSLRNRQYKAIAEFIRENDSAVFVVAGDLNCAPWSSCFGDLVSHGRLRDTRVGFGLGESWPADWWILRLPLDHVLTSKNVDTVCRVVGEDLGSDHLPVYVELLARDSHR
jgi:endonuclease/exonuclease/phosphatase (EEP) superfamily protein YafD